MDEYWTGLLSYLVAWGVIDENDNIIYPYGHFTSFIYIVFVLLCLRWERMKSIVVCISDRIKSLMGEIPNDFLSILTLIAGAVFSIYSSEIKDEIKNGVGIWVVSLSVFVFILYVVFSKKDQLVEERTVNKENELDDQLKKLKEHLSNMPPKVVLSDAATLAIRVDELIKNQSYTREKKVHLILSAIPTLAAKWDGDEKEDSYNINVMLAMECSAIKDLIRNGNTYIRDAVAQSPFFLYSDNLSSRLDRCDYILITNKSLSCGKEDDSGGANICLPLSYGDLKGKQPNIFGAPRSMFNGNKEYVSNASNHLNEFLSTIEEGNNRYSKEFKDGLKEYYKGRNCSILSIPLKNDSSDRPFAVMNIYKRTDSGPVAMLRSQVHAESFVYLISPVCKKISDLLDSP